MNKEFCSKAKEMESELIALRRRLHACPELDFNVEETVSIVEERLSALGIPNRRVAGTGLAALLKGKGSEGAVLLRADMDALPLSEESCAPWRSKHEGAMHACGHDVHTACLLGAAELLLGIAKDLVHDVLFVFQPAEETSGGALPMLSEGLLEGSDVRSAFALHCDPSLPAGRIGVHGGAFRAASDMFDCSVRGRGSHGAEPHRGDDVIAIACRTVDALHQLVGRTVDPAEPAVISIGSFHAGTARNILPERAEFSGILRTLDPETRVALKAKIRRTVMNIPDVLGAVGEVRFTEGYPALVNDPRLASLVCEAAADMLGPESVVRLTKPSMGVDDFSYFSQRAPGCYFMLGTGHGDGRDEAPLHSPRFDPDERAVTVGAAMFAELAVRAGEIHQK
jgi:amidohydrolase